jgi:hypothetical protein
MWIGEKVDGFFMVKVLFFIMKKPMPVMPFSLHIKAAKRIHMNNYVLQLIIM